MRFRSVMIGVAAGLVALAVMMIPGTRPWFWMAVLAPLAGGALAAILASREAGNELDVDEAAAEGAKAGAAGGFLLAVPLPLAMHLFVSRRASLVAGATSIGASALLLLLFLALSVIAAVIAARLYRR
jgi:hypothetical protein